MVTKRVKDVTIAPGDMLLFYNARGIARLISFFTRSRYYHVAIAVDDAELIEAMPNGVVRCALESKDNEHFVVIEAPTRAAGRSAVAWAKSKIGDGYDPKDLLAIALDRVFAHLKLHLVRGDRFTCGEFVATAFQKAGASLFHDLDPEEVVPADFARLIHHKTRAARGLPAPSAR